MNRIHPKSLLHSKWTSLEVVNKRKHFVVTELEFNDKNTVTHCVIQAVIDNSEHSIKWRALKDSTQWRLGWK